MCAVCAVALKSVGVGICAPVALVIIFAPCSKAAFVTGAASGFGLCTTRRLLARSFKVGLVQRACVPVCQCGVWCCPSLLPAMRAVVAAASCPSSSAPIVVCVVLRVQVAMVDYSPTGDAVAAALAKEFPSAACAFYRCDVSDSTALAGTFKAAAAALGPFDFVFNNAGVTEKPDFADYNRVVDINLSAVIQGSALAIEVLCFVTPEPRCQWGAVRGAHSV